MAMTSARYATRRCYSDVGHFASSKAMVRSVLEVHVQNATRRAAERVAKRLDAERGRGEVLTPVLPSRRRADARRRHARIGVDREPAGRTEEERVDGSANRGGRGEPGDDPLERGCGDVGLEPPAAMIDRGVDTRVPRPDGIGRTAGDRDEPGVDDAVANPGGDVIAHERRP